MMKTAQTDSAPSHSACPDLESLAAFVEGRLRGAEHDVVVEHLASCEACYEVYAETLRIQEDLEPSAGLAPVVRHPSSFGWGWRTAAALAASLVLAVGLLWFVFRPETVRIGDVSAILADADSSALDGREWSEYPWPRTRGSEIVRADPGGAKRAFRLGVHSVDLEAVLFLDDREAAKTQVTSMEGLLSELDLGVMWVRWCRDLRDEIASGAPREEILESRWLLVSQLTEGEYPPVDPFYFSFGRWVEKSRLAALSGASGYFSDSEFRSYLGQLEKEELPQEVSLRVAQVRSLLGEGRVVSDDVVREFDEILRREGAR